jgi:hypothetical protein
MFTPVLLLPLAVQSASVFATSRTASVITQNLQIHSQRRTTLAMADTGSYESRWEQQWSAGLDKNTSFDKGGASPALQQLLDQGVLPKGRALVPGRCRAKVECSSNIHTSSKCSCTAQYTVAEARKTTR